MHLTPSAVSAEQEPGDDERRRLGVIGGLAALSLDAISSVAYGPEAMVLVLALAGGAALDFTLPLTIAIAVLLAVLTLSYRQVIATFPEGGGAYGVAKAYLGRHASLVAGASLIVDYVLNVAVAVSAGVAALTSAFPELLPYTTVLCLLVLALITGVNMRGITASARAFIGPTVIFLALVLLVIVVGLLRDQPAVRLPAAHAVPVETVGVLLLLRAFSNGCASLTGVEAIANAVPSFRKPRIKRAQHAEVALGALLGVMLIGIAVLIEKFSVLPHPDVTVLGQVTQASLGDGALFYVVQFSTVVLLGLAANTSFGGLPVLAHLLAKDDNLPHFFALRGERPVYRYGMTFLAVVAALLLIAARGETNLLVPLFAIGVFVGFTLSQAGMVRHWHAARSPGWRGKAALNGLGALLTGIAMIVVSFSKFTEGGRLIVITLPLIVLTMDRINRAYSRIGERLGTGRTPAPPEPLPSVVIVPVHAVNELTRQALTAAVSLGDRVVAVNIGHPDDAGEARGFAEAWQRWHPGVELVQLFDVHRRLAKPLIEYLGQVPEPQVFVLIAQIEPERLWQRILQNQRGAVLSRALHRRTDTVVCRMRFRLGSPAPASTAMHR
ncbi:APC family permease [Nonomuraea africana]